jgi:hypothetical protein
MRDSLFLSAGRLDAPQSVVDACRCPLRQAAADQGVGKAQNHTDEAPERLPAFRIIQKHGQTPDRTLPALHQLERPHNG